MQKILKKQEGEKQNCENIQYLSKVNSLFSKGVCLHLIKLSKPIITTYHPPIHQKDQPFEDHLLDHVEWMCFYPMH